MIEIPEKVKDSLREGNTHKNYRMIVHDGELSFTIDNNNLVYESVTITERMSSGDELRFGLCQGSTLEFQYFDFPNIKGKRVECYLDIEYSDGTFTIPMGWFDVQKCSRQASTGIFKASCVNKLKSDYLEQDVSERTREVIDSFFGSASIDVILNSLLAGYGVENEYKKITCRVSSGPTTPSDQYYTDDGRIIYVGTCRATVAMVKRSSNYKRFRFDAGVDINYIVEKWKNTRSLDEFFYETVRYKGETIAFEYFATDILANRFIIDDRYKVGDYIGQGEIITDYSKISDDFFYIEFPVFSHTNGVYSVQNFYPAFDYLFNETTLNPAESMISDARSIGSFEVNNDTFSDVKNVSLRQLQSAVFELNAQFGQLDRETDLFSGVSLNGKRLHPHNGLHPADGLYPCGSADATQKSMYSQLWTDNVGIQNFRKLIITYKGLDEDKKEEEKVVEYVVNSSGTTDYIMDSNWLLKNLVWTDEQIDEYSLNMVSLIKDVTWFPFDMWCSGLPYLETGDEIEVTSKDGIYTTYILERTLNGIQNLQDTFINGNLDIF